MAQFSVFAPAKINLCLKVTGRRPDGYHELQSLMVALDIGDTLSFSPAVGAQRAVPLHVVCDNADIPTGPESLLGRASAFACERLGYEGGLEVLLAKQLPIGAGLGGGSSDAAALIRAVEQITDRQIPAAAYPDLAYQVGADVPFFVSGLKTAWVTGIGEAVVPCSIAFPLHILLINPGIHISTAEVYGALGRQLTTFEGPATVPPSFETLADLLPVVTNDLESVVLDKHPVIGTLQDQLMAQGADAALMSGSGSTVFGLYSQAKSRNTALEFFKAQHPDFWVCGASVSGIV